MLLLAPARAACSQTALASLLACSACACTPASPSAPSISCGPGTTLRDSVCVVADAGVHDTFTSAPLLTDAGPPLPTFHEPAVGLAYQLTHSVTTDTSFSPDGKRIVLLSVVSGKEQLFVADADGAHAKQITHDDVDHEDPAWSPTGSTLAYVRVSNGSEVIHLMGVDGTGDEALTPPDVKTIHPAFSPDGKTLAYCTDDDLHPPKKNTSDIYFVDLATRQSTKRITGGVNTYPSFSPDGKRLAYRKMLGETNSEVFVADIDGSNAKNITHDPAFDGWPRWSPDGQWIAYASNRRMNHQIYVMRPDGTDVRLVAPTEGRATAPVWSPDGKHLYFSNCFKVDFAFDCQVFVARGPV